MTTQKNAAVGDRSTNEELVQRLQEGDASAAEKLLRQNSGYLTVLTKQYDKAVRGPSPEEDLKQEGAMALLKAAEQFKPSMGNRFLTYATPAIKAAMRDCAARNALPLTIPTGRYHQLRQVLRLMAEKEKAGRCSRVTTWETRYLWCPAAAIPQKPTIAKCGESCFSSAWRRSCHRGS